MPGLILYRGPSLLDGAPIVAIAIDSSSNRKTGNMVQTYIMRADVEPMAALKSGDDASVCGNCKHRPILGGACYVNVGQGPLSVYRAFTRGRYPVSDTAMRIALGHGRAVRLGTYGDPMAVPAYVWQSLLSEATNHTGYTHQWADPAMRARNPQITSLCMASADTPAEADAAHTLGYRTFRVRAAADPLMPGEFVCPASEEAGKRRQCDTCKACNGSHPGTHAASPVIIVHGALKSRFANYANPA